ncbi:MAG: CAP domain-containing protein [Primorskyibacter sp.]
MTRAHLILLAALLALGACTVPSGTSTLGPDGRPLPRAYWIQPQDSARVQYTVLDALNSLRLASGQNPVMLDANLTASAATHARDMSVQNRAWHFGSDGSSPIDRARRAGFTGVLRGETISETFESEVQTLGAWMRQPATRDVLMDSLANRVGISWHQEDTGKLWWVLVLGQL